MKVKIVCTKATDTLENEINEFIKNVEVIEIKFSATEFDLTAMVIYKELESE